MRLKRKMIIFIYSYQNIFKRTSWYGDVFISKSKHRFYSISRCQRLYAMTSQLSLLWWVVACTNNEMSAKFQWAICKNKIVIFPSQVHRPCDFYLLSLGKVPSPRLRTPSLRILGGRGVLGLCKRRCNWEEGRATWNNRLFFTVVLEAAGMHQKGKWELDRVSASLIVNGLQNHPCITGVFIRPFVTFFIWKKKS